VKNPGIIHIDMETRTCTDADYFSRIEANRWIAPS